ncbi:nickel pincer cofactor biosynthesis protein LarC [Magnetococcales bacterium HHB-1]
MKVHLDLSSGMAGDMFLAACLDLGLELQPLIQSLQTLPLPEWSLEPLQDKRGGIAGTRLDFKLPDEKAHRHLSTIRKIIDESTLLPPVKEGALAIFTILAEAEGAVHGISPEKVHFHEVGAMDAILDICGAAYAIDKLEINAVTATPPVVGSGTVSCAHGVMPVPTPATAEILRKHQIPVQPDTVQGEMLTPTGAAILAYLSPRFGSPELTQIDHIGFGLGTRKIPGRANALRILSQKESSEKELLQGFQRDRVSILTTHIDDMNPEWFGPLWDILFDEGVLDLALIPMQMKKGRPASRLEVICPPDKEDHIAQLVLTHTTALGLRIRQSDRLILTRQKNTVETPWGKVTVVEAGGIPRIEHDDLADIARMQNWSILEAERRIRPFVQNPF